ncbi:MAG TPA: rod shape-determining protein MreD [Desulfosporosinus sp.]|nr:rod shape-determining protein MreD [Desulfosporosinus sp.]
MRYVLIAAMFLLSLILPGTVFHFWSWSGVKPDFLMLLTIYIAMHNRLSTSIYWGLGAGLLQDLYLGRYLGMYTLTLAVVAYISYWLAERWYRENLILSTFLVFLVTAVGQTIVAVLSLGAGIHWAYSDITHLVFGIAIYNTVLVPLTYPFIHKSFVSGWLRLRPKYER